MKARGATFIKSAVKPEDYPVQSHPEIAFAGRSNVGKSSLINTLVGVPKLARTSNTPGRTRLLNWFEVQPQKGAPVHLVDLPGYGYAKVPKEMRNSWQPMIESYLRDRAVLRLVMVLVDARRGVRAEEEQLIEWLLEQDVPVAVILTKCDKLPKSRRKPLALKVKKELGLAREPIMTSSESKDGIADLWKLIGIVTR